jgi:hypothetical protein
MPAAPALAPAAQLPPPSVLLTELKMPLMLVASELIVARRATVIRPNVTAYSAAVGPSSLTRNCEINRSPRDIASFS